MERDEIEAMVKATVQRAGTAHTTRALLGLAALAFSYLIEDGQLPGFTAYVNENTMNEDVTPAEMGLQLAMHGIVVTSLHKESELEHLEELFNKS